MRRVLVFRFSNASSSDLVSLGIASHQGDAQNDECQNEQRIATNVNCKSDEVARSIPR